MMASVDKRNQIKVEEQQAVDLNALDDVGRRAHADAQVRLSRLRQMAMPARKSSPSSLSEGAAK